MSRNTALLTRIKSKSQVTIPARIRKNLDLEEGDILEASVEKDHIVLTPKRVHDRNSASSAVAEGLADLKAGRVIGPFKNVRAFKSALKERRDV